MNKAPIPTIIVTVGTALINNLKNDERKRFKKYVETPEAIEKALNSKESINFIVSELLTHDMSDKILGPEINSTSSLLQRGVISPDNMFLIVSDTIEGEFEGRILKRYFEHEKQKTRFKKVEIKRIEGLQSQDEHKFRNKGLRNLVCAFAEIIQAHDEVVINATGGYKAEIAYATVIGQSFEKPVYYQFENFKTVIELPPQPISLDFEFYLNARTFLKRLDEGSIDGKEYEEYRKALGKHAPVLDGLVERISEMGKSLYCLSPMGKLFYEKCIYWWGKHKVELPEDIPPEEKKMPKISDPTALKVKNFERFLIKLVKEVPYIKEFHSIYANKDLPRISHFRIEGENVVLVYSDGSRTAKAVIYTSARDIEQKRKVVEDLNTRFEKELA